MSTIPEPDPNDPEERSSAPVPDPLSGATSSEPPAEGTPEPEARDLRLGSATEFMAPPAPTDEIRGQPVSVAYLLPQPIAPRAERIPHLGHVVLLGILAVFGWLGAGMLLLFALQIHLWGITSLSVAITDFRYTLASQAAQYLITFAACLAIFPIVWHRPFFVGVQWRGSFAAQRSGRLVGAAVVCFFVAIINGMLMPGPTNAPIDQLFRAPGAAWAMFGFGITLAPFFEEMAFRGFLLPSLCTAWDWTMERFAGAPRRPLGQDGGPLWSRPAMIVSGILTSIPFALMHGAQTGWSLGPFLLLIFVSLVLCWVRLSARSLAASTLVHASYNFMLFSFMLLGTGGFKHLDRM